VLRPTESPNKRLAVLKRPCVKKITGSEVPINFGAFSFGSIRIDGINYEHVSSSTVAQFASGREAVETLSRGIWTHAGIGRGGNPVGLQTLGDRYWGRRIAGHGLGQA
jgi:hypothetical protein